jgi:formamidopyrimidine-DNA glycosylase
MEGKYWLKQKGDPLDRHTHAVFTLSDGRELRYNDTRKFGTMELCAPDTDRALFHGLGPEPFDDSFTADYLYRIMKERNTPVKTILLDQTVVAGIGTEIREYRKDIIECCPEILTARDSLKAQAKRGFEHCRREMHRGFRQGLRGEPYDPDKE